MWVTRSTDWGGGVGGLGSCSQNFFKVPHVLAFTILPSSGPLISPTSLSLSPQVVGFFNQLLQPWITFFAPLNLLLEERGQDSWMGNWGKNGGESSWWSPAWAAIGSLDVVSGIGIFYGIINCTFQEKKQSAFDKTHKNNGLPLSKINRAYCHNYNKSSLAF